VALELSPLFPLMKTFRKLLENRKQIVDAFQHLQAIDGYSQLARKAIEGHIPSATGGHLEFFLRTISQQKKR